MAKKKSKSKARAQSVAKARAAVQGQGKSQGKPQNPTAQASAANSKPAKPVKAAQSGKQPQAAKPAKPAANKKRIGIIVGVVVAVVAAVAIGVFAFMNTGKNNLLQPNGYDTSKLQVYSGAQSSDGGKTVTYNGATYKLNENVVPICIMGNDKGLHTPDAGTNGQADAIMVIAVNSETNDITGISIPRDSMISSLKKFRDVYKNSSYKTDKMQICLAYACGDNDEQSSEYVANGASELLFGIPIKYHYTLWTDGLGELADLADGVTLEALNDIPRTGSSSDSTDIIIKAGETVTLRGSEALRYVQFRDTSRYETALERLERQRQFVSALAKKLLEQVKGNPSKALDIISTLQKYSQTNLGTAEMSYLASLAAGTNTSDFTPVRLQGEAVHNSDNPWEQFLVDEESTYQVVLDTFYTKVS